MRRSGPQQLAVPATHQFPDNATQADYQAGRGFPHRESSPPATPPPRPKRPYKVGDANPNLIYDITPEAVRNLRGFLDATGSTCLYGINLGINIPDLAAEEAAFANKTLGDRLEYFPVCNEADHFGSMIRGPRTWNANTCMDEWLKFANAIRARVPKANFGRPDPPGILNGMRLSSIGSSRFPIHSGSTRSRLITTLADCLPIQKSI